MTTTTTRSKSGLERISYETPHLFTLVLMMINEEDVLSLRFVSTVLRHNVDNNEPYWKYLMDKNIHFMTHIPQHVDPCPNRKCRKYEHYIRNGPPISLSPLYSHTFMGYVLRKADTSWKTVFWHQETMNTYKWLLRSFKEEIEFDLNEHFVENGLYKLVKEKLVFINKKRQLSWEDMIQTKNKRIKP